MTCRTMMDKVYDAWGAGPLPLLFRLRLGIHGFFCPQCAEEIQRLETTQEIMEQDFFPEAPTCENLIMERIYREEPELTVLDPDPLMGVSFRSWVITGCIVLISLSTAFFNLDFIKIAASQGSSFLLPVGLTIGCVVTSYGALFIGSHLKELSEWFRLH